MPGPMLTLIHKMLGHSIVLVTSLGLFDLIDFTRQVSLGSVILPIVIVIAAGLFTLRSKVANIWREEAQGERAAKERLEAELLRERAERTEYDKQQQELRHELKDQIAGLTSQLKVMEAKTDLSLALGAIKEMNEHTATVMVEAMKSGSELSRGRDETTHLLLGEIRDKLPDEPIIVHETNPE